MADRYAAFFLPATMFVAGVAWAISGDPVRALAVFVVATPCPLILAAPIALMSGLSRAARAGVVVKGAGTIEQLGEARTVLFDKTGTITLGHPRARRVVAARRPAPDEMLRLAASLDQTLRPIRWRRRSSPAPSSAAWRLTLPDEVEEQFGQGIAGTVDGHRVLVGSAGWLRAHGIEPQLPSGASTAAPPRCSSASTAASPAVVLLGDRLRDGRAPCSCRGCARPASATSRW